MANLLYKIKATDEVKGRAHASLGTVDSGILSKARIFQQQICNTDLRYTGGGAETDIYSQ